MWQTSFGSATSRRMMWWKSFQASDEEKYDLVHEGVVIFTGALAKHLAKDDPKVHVVVEKLLDGLNTPSEAVQRAVSTCLSPLMLTYLHIVILLKLLNFFIYLFFRGQASDEEKYDLVHEGVVILIGALAKHLAKDDPKVHAVVEKLLDGLNTPSEAVQRAVLTCLSPLMQSKQVLYVESVSRERIELLNLFNCTP
ncbi:hypothetical protein L1049_027794 [Liquidambar formosana]|uniref:Uncharacterized protein n=1 Tax=Liquidambar formosana TaxID=63359 RepID=A0AAP0RHZ4_LIQFO